MLKSIEATGKTEEDAIVAALSKLGLSRDEVSVEVVERAKAGFLGIGGSPAIVRISYEVDDEKKKGEIAKEFLSGLFERLGVDAAIELSESEDGTLNIKLNGENIGSLIGRRGETLDAIQHLTNYVVNRSAADRVRINLDAENYRAKREEALVKLAEKIAAKVVRYRRKVTLEPMNAYERHVIHTALQGFAGVTTYSVGTEPNRRVVVAFESQQNQSAGSDSANDDEGDMESEDLTKQEMNTSGEISNNTTREWS